MQAAAEHVFAAACFFIAADLKKYSRGSMLLMILEINTELQIYIRIIWRCFY